MSEEDRVDHVNIDGLSLFVGDVDLSRGRGLTDVEWLSGGDAHQSPEEDLDAQCI